eukprot:m51a1_g5562 hypothetical protein (816) ;mRNA; f:577506-581091
MEGGAAHACEGPVPDVVSVVEVVPEPVRVGAVRSKHFPRTYPLGHQFVALFKKNVALQRRQKATNVCQILTPFVVIVFTGILHHVIGGLFDNGSRAVISRAPTELFPWTNQTRWASASSEVWVVDPRDAAGALVPGIPRVREGGSDGGSGNATWMPAVLRREREAALQAIDAEKVFRVSMINSQFQYFKGTPEHSFPLAVKELGFNYTLKEYLLGMPYRETGNAFDTGSWITAYLTPFALSFLMPVYIYTIVHEKQQRLREMMRMMGLWMPMYWAINYVYDVLMYLVVCIIYIAIGLAFQLRVFTIAPAGVQVCFYLGFGLSQVSLSFFFSAFFSRSRNATIGSYMIVIFSILLAFVWNLAAWPIVNGSQISWIVLLYPPWAAYRAFANMGINCGDEHCPQGIDGELYYAAIILWVSVPVLYILAVYLDAVLPQEFGIREHPLFFLRPLKRLLLPARGSERPEAEADTEKDAGADGEELDVDVREERDLVNDLARKKLYSEAPLLVQNAGKTYGSGSEKKVALQGVTLHVNKGECLGLLGPNGAGKTTLISVLTGLFPATHGTARIAGHDVATQLDEIHKDLGVCPQFDTLWPELTPRETLVFYATLRGIAPSLAPECASHILESLGMSDVENMQVRFMSGGLRRRLSIAVALVGDPQVLFLDEPTTGLDVITRRQLWEVLIEAQAGRSTVLTTHSMEEADALCQRISIIAGGKLQAVGSNVHLKDRFGGGYSIRASFKAADEERVDKFVESIAPGAHVTDSMKGLKTWRVPTGASVAAIFHKMVDGCFNAGITNWGVAQASLEDVFLALAKSKG